jgi:ADP-ribose pyrophosphatase YjhB (NUDIX family)
MVVDWARRLAAVAQSGLAYGEVSEYDRERYETVRRVAAEMLADGDAASALERVLAREVGHATPKIDVRGVVFREDEILLVRERVDDAWTLPGGWADVGESPAESVVREVREESGYDTRVVKVLALLDRARHHPPNIWHTWKIFFLCELVGGEPAPLGTETTGRGFFPLDGLPPLSINRVTREQIARCFAHRDHPEWPTDFD